MRPDLEAYRSIFLDDGWAHQKYYGWSQIEASADLRILRKRRKLIDRFLVLTDQSDEAAADVAISKIGSALHPFEIVVHNFSQSPAAPRLIGRRRFEPVADKGRLLNIKTVAIDLSATEAQLSQNMSADYRRKIRKAATGVRIDLHEKPDAALQLDFVTAFRQLAKERALQPLDPAVIAAMYRQGDALLFTASKDDQISHFLHIYCAGDSAIFMHGVNPAKGNDGAGQLIHWEAMRTLKQRGLRWYDLGGVTSFDPANGIYKFKRDFGGVNVSLGSETHYSSVGFKLAMRAVNLVRRAG